MPDAFDGVVLTLAFVRFILEFNLLSEFLDLNLELRDTGAVRRAARSIHFSEILTGQYHRSSCSSQ